MRKTSSRGAGNELQIMVMLERRAVKRIRDKEIKNKQQILSCLHPLQGETERGRHGKQWEIELRKHLLSRFQIIQKSQIHLIWVRRES